MPSSLVFAALVLAWLAVLVPVIARRRQMVPRPADVDLSARVLPRSVGAPVNEEPPVTHSSGGRGGSAVATVGSRGSAAVADADEPPARDDEDVEPYADDVEDDRYAGDDRYADDAYEDDRYDDRDDDGYDDEPAPAPRSYRPGRGGFDPEAAAVAAQSRYAFRQRVAVGLIAVAVLSALAALIVTPILWSLHLVTDVVLVGYLVFLRRQTRIEEDLRERRAARLSGERRALEARRDRQAEHDERMAAVEEYSRDGGYDDDDRDGAVDGYDDDYDEYEDYAERYLDRYDDEDDDEDDDDRYAPEEAVTRLQPAPRTPTPALPEGLELVADSDDDPAFHPLDGREIMPSYRRAAGA